MFITANLMGGLGNQLFQIFATIAHSMKINYDIIFAYSGILTTGKERHTYWNNFMSSLLKYTTLNLDNELTNRDLDKFLIYREQGFRYSNIPLFTDKNMKLYGYFQSHKYFEDPVVFNKICDMIDLKNQQSDVKFVYKNFFPDETRVISMHFRLGDYKFIQEHHPVMPYEYYDNAITNILIYTRNLHKSFTPLNNSIHTADELSTKLPVTDLNIAPILGVDSNLHRYKYQVNYFCEKEDNTFVLDIIKRLEVKYNIVKFVKVDDDIEDWQQLLLMSCCHDNIIANSSFSWWGAYFNNTENKTVCYPYLWFGPANNSNVTDLFPNTWVKVSFYTSEDLK